MKKLLFPIVAAIFALTAVQSCSKGGGGGACNETTMTVVTDPASDQPPGVGPDFIVHVNITANKPQNGVTIEVKARQEGQSTFFYNSGAISTTATNNNFTITGTPSTVTSIVEITVTSKTCATNKVTKTYRYSKK